MPPSQAVTATSDQGAQCKTGLVGAVPDAGDEPEAGEVPEAGVVPLAPVGAPVFGPLPEEPDEAEDCPFELLPLPPPPHAASATATARNTPPSSTRRP